MDRLPMCRICLAENVRLSIVANRNLHKLYETLTNVPFETEDSRPMLACVFCFAKLKQCYRLRLQCLKAEELFGQKISDKNELNPVVNEKHFVIFGGLIKSRIQQINVVNCIAAGEELSAVCEGPDDVIEPKEEHQNKELEPGNLYSSCLDVADIPPHCSKLVLEDDVPLMICKYEMEDEKVFEVEDKKNRRATETIKLEPENLDNISLNCYESYLEDDIPLMKCKTEVKDEKVSKKEGTVTETIKLEPENLDSSCLDVADIPPYSSESVLEHDVPLMICKYEMEDEEVFEVEDKKNRRATETIKLEPEKLDNISLDVADISLHCYESYLEDDIPLMKCKTEVEDEKVSKKEGRVTETIKATVVRDPKQDTQRTKEKDAIAADQTTNDKSDSKIIRTTQKWTSKRGTYFKKPYISSQSSSTNVKKEYKCDICQRVYTQRQRLVIHIRTHTGENPFKCDVCQRIFYQNYLLKNHMRTHTGEKPYKCVVCPSNFTRESNLTMHMRIHTGVKPYTCYVCKINFVQKSHLNSHMRTHTGEKPYKCDICQRDFSRNGSLKVHMRTHTGEKLFKCNVCPHSFSIESNLTRHMRTH